MDADLDHVGRAAGVEVLGGGDQLVAGPAGGEHVELHLHRGEVVAGRQVAEGLPGGDAVGQRDPGAAVDEPAGMQVALVDDDPPARALVADLERLDPEVGREAARDPRAQRLGGDLGIRLGTARRVSGRPATRRAIP